MALIACPDCGTEVSDKAESCPKCSRPHPALADRNLVRRPSLLVQWIIIIWGFNFVFALVGWFMTPGSGAKSPFLALLVGPLYWLIR